MSAAGVPAVPEGLRAGQLGTIVIGRVIMGDIAVTLVDLAQRKLLAVGAAGDDGDWLLTPSPGAAGRQVSQLPEYESRLPGGLAEFGAPARLCEFGPVMNETRAALVRELCTGAGCGTGIVTSEPPKARISHGRYACSGGSFGG